MPTYFYACSECKTEFKVFHNIDDKQTCIKCTSEKIQKQFKASTINISAKDSTAKDRVEKFIEEARENLKEQIQETRKDYKP